VLKTAPRPKGWGFILCPFLCPLKAGNVGNSGRVRNIRNNRNAQKLRG
jgi:hypothetical protein